MARVVTEVFILVLSSQIALAFCPLYPGIAHHSLWGQNRRGIYMVERMLGSRDATVAMRDENDLKCFQPAKWRDFPLASMI
jgi:hypothetical protein